MTEGINRAGRGLSAKLLGLTLMFIMVAEVLVFLPSLGARLQSIGTQSLLELERGVLVFEVLGGGDPEARTIGNNFSTIQAQLIQQELVRSADWLAFAAFLPNDRSLMTLSDALVADGRMPTADRRVTVTGRRPLPPIGTALAIALDFGPPKVLMFNGTTAGYGSKVNIWMDDGEVRQALRAYALRIFLISLGISIFAAALVYIALRRLIVRPIERLRENLGAFAAHPDDVSRLIKPSKRNDEIGFIEAETRAMQTTILTTLQQKERLAALGSAVAQVNHDLRGMLSTALLLSDSLESSQDPKVAKAAPILANAIERAVELCSSTLKFAKGSGEALNLAPHTIGPTLAPLAADWRLRWPQLALTLTGPPECQARLDPQALYRILDNLTRNAVEAGAPSVAITWAEVEETLALKVADTGPGLPQKASANLFVPFAGSTKRDGTGLGVSTAADLALAMGGRLVLQETGPSGTTFALTLPLDKRQE